MPSLVGSEMCIRDRHMGYVGDRRGTQRCKERHLAHGLPGLQEIVAAGLGGNPVARIPVQSPNTPRPQIITSAATSRPSVVIGTTSPYPTVVRVAIAHHKAAGTLPKVAGWTSRSR